MEDQQLPNSESEANRTSVTHEVKEYPAFLQLYRSTLRQELLAVFGLFALLVLFRLQVLPHIEEWYVGGFRRDAGLYVWLVKSNLRDLFSLAWFNTAAFHPYTRTLAWSDNFILPSLAVWPLLKAGLPLASAYNLVLLSAHFLAGYCTYRLAFRLTGLPLASLFSGALFMNASVLLGRLGHPQLQFAFWLPVACSVMFSWIARPTAPRAALFSLTIVGAFLCSVYYASFAVLLAGAIFVMQVLLRPHQFRARDIVRLILGGLLGIAPIVPFLVPYLQVREMFGGRHLYEAYYFAATTLSYLTFSPHNFAYGWTSGFSHAEAHLGAGLALLAASVLCLSRLCEARQLRRPAMFFLVSFLLLLLLSSLRPVCRAFNPDVNPEQGMCAFALTQPFVLYGAALCLWGSFLSLAWLLTRMGTLERQLGFLIMTNRGLIASFVFAAFFFFALSLGPLGNPAKREFAPGVFTPFFYLFPGFSSIRAVSRLGIVVVFCFCILFAFATTQLRTRVSRGVYFSFALFALALVENYHSVLPQEPETPSSIIFDQLTTLSKPGDVVMVLPYSGPLKQNGTVASWGEFAELNVKYMHWVFPLGLATVNGYSGLRSKVMLDYPRWLAGFPDQRSLDALEKIQGLRFVVYASQDAPGEFDAEAFLERAKAHSSRLTFLGSDESGNYLFELTGRIRVTDDYILRTPSFPEAYLHIEFLALYEPDSPEQTIELLELDHFGGNVIAQVTLPADGNWQQYSIRLPAPGNPARPFRLKFQRKGDFKLYLRNPRRTPLSVAYQ